MALITAISGVANITAATVGAQINLSVAAPGGGGGVAIAASNSTYTSGTVVISGSNNLTASYNAGTILLSVPTQSTQPTGVSAVAASNSTITSGTVVLSGSGALTASYNGQTVLLSVPTGASATGNVGGVAASNSTITSGTVVLSGSGALTASYNGQTVLLSVPAGASATGNLGAIAMNAATTYTSGTVVLSAGNNITLGSAGQTITISGVAAQTAQTFVSGIAASNTTYTSGVVSITGVGGGVTVSSNTGQRVDISVAAPVAQSVQTLGIYASSQTYGASSSSTYSAQSLSIVGQGGISVGWTNGSLALSGPTAVAAAMNIAASNTTYTSGTVSFTGVGGGVTVSSNTGQRVDISVAAQTNQSEGWYALSQTTGASSSTTLDARSVSVNAAGQLSVGFSAGSVQLSGPGLLGFFLHNSAAMYSFVASGQTNASASVIHIHIPEAMTFTRVDVPVSIQTASSATAATAAIAISSVAVLYSRNASTLNPIVGVSGTQTVSWVSNTGIANSATGPRLASFNLATSLTAGDYWLGLHMSTTSGISTGAATTALNATVSILLGAFVASMTATGWGDINAATNASFNPWFPFQGVISSAITATGQTLQMSQITHTGTALVRANPMVLLRSAL